MTAKIAFALHAHQPLGNPDSVVRGITESAYKPLLQNLRRHSDLTISYHASGLLMQWWERRDPTMIDLIGELVDAGQLELLTGGYYEPVLPLIPRRDRIAQVQKHCQYLEKRFNVRPQGLWLTERVWYPDLPEIMDQLGISYTVVDDYHFHLAGWKPEDVSSFYWTESSGARVALFPISKELRYRIPFHDLPDIEKFVSESGADVLTMADDAEKFGAWPDTQKWVYEQGWLERFFEACAEGRLLLHSLEEIFREEAAGGMAYLPTASYEEMMEWSLPSRYQSDYTRWKQDAAADVARFGRGGHFHYFLNKYEESNRLHKRMLWLSKQMEPSSDEAAYQHLLAAQCNDSYWHGVFGGLFLPHLRAAVWNRLSRAYRAIGGSLSPPRQEDYDLDGNPEVLYGDESQFLILDPFNGGEALDWELFPACRNVLDSLTRRWEAYLTEADSAASRSGESEVDTIHHRRSTVPESWLSDWSTDPVTRAGFQPVAVASDGCPQGIQKNQGLEYLLREQDPQHLTLDENSVHLRYDSNLSSIRYRFSPGELIWSGTCQESRGGFWGVLTTLGFRSSERDHCRIRVEGRTFSVMERLNRETSRLQLEDDLAGLNLTVVTPEPVQLMTHPVQSISRSEESVERIYQGTAILLITPEKTLQLSWRWGDHT